ncbi:MAG TPA: alpha/beta fold hydrolase [Pseudonocardiaceae bacterium]
MPVLPGAEPFSHDGSSKIGVLLCHGFTGTPQSMRDWGTHLAEAGFTVRCPRLPGHGTHWREMNRTTWADWYSCLDTVFEELTGRCESVFAFGLSMGGTLALRLAQQRGTELAGLAVVNPSVTTLRRDAFLLPVLSRVLPSLPGIGSDIAKPGVRELAYDRLPLRAAASLAQLWRITRADLHRITQPIVVFRSAVDHVVEPVNARIVLEGVSSQDVTDVVLPRSYHVATLDHDAPTIFERSVEFALRVHAQRVGEPA